MDENKDTSDGWLSSGCAALLLTLIAAGCVSISISGCSPANIRYQSPGWSGKLSPAIDPRWPRCPADGLFMAPLAIQFAESSSPTWESRVEATLPLVCPAGHYLLAPIQLAPGAELPVKLIRRVFTDRVAGNMALHQAETLETQRAELDHRAKLLSARKRARELRAEAAAIERAASGVTGFQESSTSKAKP